MSCIESGACVGQPPVIIVMGVCGSGKSTVGEALAKRLAFPFLDADGYHPETNITKMSNGVPLTDDDRWPWLLKLGAAMRQAADEKGGVIAACSALKRSYRTALNGHTGLPVRYVFLDGDRNTLFNRISARTDHYMPPGLLDSQLADLEKPAPDERAFYASIEKDVCRIVEAVVHELCKAGGSKIAVSEQPDL